jgi:hypothetical protein
MRKTLLIVAASAATFALAPATALAKHNERHHHRRGHHVRVHHESFGGDQGQPGDTNQAQPAATVVSFTNGVLTIRANDGNTASGQVTNGTELDCVGAEPAEMRNHDHGGGDNRGGDNGQGDDDRGDDQGQGDDEAAQMCTTADLVPGAMVQDARLSISGAGAVWDKVELVTPSTSSTSTSGDDD